MKMLPWQDGILKEWSIVGMNHYNLSGKRCLFVSMTKGDICIKEEGEDDEFLWNRLWHKASNHKISQIHKTRKPKQ